MDILIANEVDKQNCAVKIKLANKIGHSPVMPFFLKNYAQLMELGQATQLMVGSNNSKSIYVEYEDKVIAAIVFDILKDASSTTWILFSCVDENFRRRGLYKLMHKYHAQEVKKLGSTKTAAHVHIENKTMLASCITVGMNPVYVRTEKLL